MLRFRLMAAATILIPLVLLLVADLRWNAGIPGVWLFPLGLVLSWMAAAEVLDLVRTPGHRPLAWTTYLGVTLVFASAFATLAWPLCGRQYPANCPLGTLGWPFLALAIAVIVAFVGEMRRYEQPGGVVVNLALSVFAITYVGVPLAFAGLLRQSHGNQWGMAALISVVWIVKLSDTGAYFLGRALGRTKLAPKISPGKTVAGGVGCLASAMLASIVFCEWLGPLMTGSPLKTPWYGAAIYGLLLGIVGAIGDLGESLMKRDLGRKDSSSWLPGLGGVLDILDSLLFAMPVAYACWNMGLLGPALSLK